MGIVMGIPNVEKPKYEVMKTDGPIEIRQYEPMIIAQVTTHGDRREALNAGFRYTGILHIVP